jgi:hypothetical protein
MKTFQQLIEKLEEDGMGGAPTNSASSGNIAGLGGDPVPVGSRKRKTRKCDSKFMGCPVYKVTSEEYQKCLRGKGKYERYANYMEDDRSADIKGQVKRTGASSIIVQNDKTGEMSYLFRR